MKVITPFMAAMDFLTRLAPARIHDEKTIAASVKYFPLVGLVLGGLLTLPFALGLLSGYAWIQAWLLTGASLWATRGLHWDGWADLFDAWGSGASGDRFWEIIKDSHIGAFGVMGLIMGMGGQVLLLHEALAAKAFGTIAFSFVLGRGLCVGLAYCSKGLSRSAGLGKLTLQGATLPSLIFALALTIFVGLGLRPLHALAPALMISLLGMVELHTLARKSGGLNGDFLGAAIIWGELSALVGWLLAVRADLLPLF
ncbi:adenosylcobinamide-GDP ribazoletransferase [Desulfovibrio ferrophilus]|uniref:Adenosylcobinamide-GDP ribazoletransferase n=1 Tax=Desulfovibrio ferrophilus TaxID=241368 RepID=A0A2Z6B2I2_9BACT|nr:adenosylcobinamide-GDP ribazoletransferase [Desulfovibrio ferrophilus]BBD09626.1 cobalamin synthase [Desulfovibrio ferrophilus]